MKQKLSVEDISTICEYIDDCDIETEDFMGSLFQQNLNKPLGKALLSVLEEMKTLRRKNIDTLISKLNSWVAQFIIKIPRWWKGIIVDC